MRITKSLSVGSENGLLINYIEGNIDSSEDKPTEQIAEGSILVETDTGDVYFFSENANAWIKQFSFQG